MADAGVRPVAWRDVRLPGLGPDSVALVTGASGSLGSATTAALAALGVRVGAMGRSGDLLRGLAQDIGGEQVLPFVGDVSQESDALGAVSAVVDGWQRLDVLIHLAAV
ncbi:MAG: SDR family NAD(P)-dependent oxidoreductase, partial [Actinomycetota bacterium]|nr:SDR family NAD(P)-dependent oxidoreductase [Actinomycetota bacterium]